MTDPKQIEKARILTDLTGLAQNLITGGLQRAQPDLLILGRVLLSSISEIQKPGGEAVLLELLQELKTISATAEQRNKNLEDQLLDLGISLK